MRLFKISTLLIVIAIGFLIYGLWPKPQNITPPFAESKTEVAVEKTLEVKPVEHNDSQEQLAAPTATPESVPVAAAMIEHTIDPMTECWDKIKKQAAEQIKPAKPPKLNGRGPRYERLNRALSQAGLMQDPEQNAKKLDPDKALHKISHLTKKDPQNSAPLLFSAAIEYQRGHTAAAQTLLAKARASTTRFDSYSKSSARDLLKKVSNPADLINAYEKLNSTPKLDYLPVQKMLIELEQPDLARQMAADGLDDRKTVEGLDWVPDEYGTSRLVLGTLGDTNGYPEFNDLKKTKTATNPIATERIEQLLSNNCDLESLNPLVEELRKKLQSP